MSNLHGRLWPKLDRAAAWHDHTSKPFKVIGWQNLGEQISHVELGIHMRRNTDSTVSQNANPILATINMLKLSLESDEVSDGPSARYDAEEYFGERWTILGRDSLLRCS